MKVGIELFKGKILSDGSNPIAIRITDKGKTKYRMTGISCRSKYWNRTKKCITCREKNFREKNEIIIHRYNEICSRAEWFIKNRYEIDFDYIFSNNPLELYNKINITIQNMDYNNFYNIIKAKIDSIDRVKTQQNYILFQRLMIKLYGEYINTNSINQMFALQFRSKIDEENISTSYKNAMITRFLSCYNFGVENRMITNPFSISLKKYPYQPKKKDLSNEEFTNIINLYKKQIAANFPFDDIKPISLFCLNVALQGLAPLDFAMLKIKDLKLCKIRLIDIDVEKYNNDNEYRNFIDNNQQERFVIKINTTRIKTNTYVPICTDFITIKNILYNLCKGKTKDDYLIDCFSKDITYTEKQLRNRCSHYFCNQSAKLNTFLSSENIRTKVTFYTARHAFINCLDKKNISHDLIRKMVGHKTNSLEKNYINKPTDWEQSSVIYEIFNSVETINNLEKLNKDFETCNKEWYELKQFLSDDIIYY